MWTIPGVGTEYILQITQVGSSTSTFDTLTVLNVNQHIGGKWNVVSSIIHGQIEAGFSNIEPNGDYSFGVGGPILIKWTTFPTGTRQTISDPIVDTFEGSVHLQHSDVRSYIGEENVTTAAGEFSALHIRETRVDIQMTGSDTLARLFSDTEIVDYWFAPSIGRDVKWIDNLTENGQPQPQREEDIINYIPE